MSAAVDDYEVQLDALASRGEPILAALDKTIVLETQSLIVNADVTEIVYSDMNPPAGVFERFTVDLAAWVKSEADRSASATGSASERILRNIKADATRFRGDPLTAGTG